MGGFFASLATLTVESQAGRPKTAREIDATGCSPVPRGLDHARFHQPASLDAAGWLDQHARVLPGWGDQMPPTVVG